MLLIALLWQTLSNLPADAADALRPENRSEVAVVMERLAALETAAIEREAKIAGLERRLHDIELQQPLNRRGPYPPKVLRNPGGQRPSWAIQWLQTGVRWQTNGDLAWDEPEPLGTTEPQPNQVRGTWAYGWHESEPTIKIGTGPDTAEYWIAPPVHCWGNPLEHGFLLGTESFCIPPEERSIFEALEELLRPSHDGIFGSNGW